MKIIEPGKSTAKVRRTRCEDCKCLFEYEDSETRSSLDPRDFGIHVVACPSCRKELYRNY